MVLTIVETTLTLAASEAQRRRNAEPAPYYMWALHATDGTRLSRGSGPLELVLDPIVSVRNRPNQIGPWFRINSRGYRGGELRPGSGLRVVVVGGSTAFGTGVRSDAETFGAALERELGVEVVNSAVIGFMAVQERALLQTELLGLRPRVVIALDGWNDLGIGRSSQIHGLLSEAFVQIELMAMTGAEVNRNVLAALGKMASHAFPHTRALIARLGPHASPGPLSDDYVAHRAAVFAESHAAMAAACEPHGCRLVTVLQPYRGAVGPYDLFVRQTLAAHRRADLHVFDASRVLERSSDNFLDDYHLTAMGNARLAQAVAPIVRPMLGAQGGGRDDGRGGR